MATVQPGSEAPDFSIETHDGTTVRLHDFRGQKAVVLFFYPRASTPACTAEACTFRDANDDFTESGAVVIGVSADNNDRQQRFADKNALPFALVSDADGALRKAYGVEKRWGLLPGRVTFVIDRCGIVRHVFDSSFFVRRHSGDALDIVRQLSAGPTSV
jgi:peroxiredoxin Q/BCP